MDDAYMEALARAAGSLAAQSKAKEERDKQNNPLYKIGSILEPVGAIADMIPGVPPPTLEVVKDQVQGRNQHQRDQRGEYDAEGQRGGHRNDQLGL